MIKIQISWSRFKEICSLLNPARSLFWRSETQHFAVPKTEDSSAVSERLAVVQPDQFGNRRFRCFLASLCQPWQRNSRQISGRPVHHLDTDWYWTFRGSHQGARKICHAEPCHSIDYHLYQRRIFPDFTTTWNWKQFYSKKYFTNK